MRQVAVLNGLESNMIFFSPSPNIVNTKLSTKCELLKEGLIFGFYVYHTFIFMKSIYLFYFCTHFFYRTTEMLKVVELSDSLKGYFKN